MSSSGKKPSSFVGRSSTGASPKRRSKSPTKPDSPGKGKGKVASRKPQATDEDDDDDEDDDGADDDDDEEEDEEEEEDEDVEMDEDEDEEEEEGKERIDPSAILGHRTRGKRIDYASQEALKRAGLAPEVAEDDDTDTR